MKPYTYLIVFKPTNQFYYGVRYAKKCDPDELWKTYFTSSRIVHSLIENNSINDFNVEIRRVFTSKHKAIKWEQKVISKIINNPLCLNKAYFGHNGNLIRSDIENINAAKKSAITRTTKILNNGLTIAQNAGKKISYKLNNDHNLIKRRSKSFRTSSKYIKFKENLSKRIKGKNNPVNIPGVKIKISNSLKTHYKENIHPMFGKKHLDSSKLKMSNAKIGEKNPCFNKIWCNNGIENIRVYENDIPIGFNKGRISFKIQRNTYICPHCKKEGAGPNMKRYHFKNCKQNKDNFN